MTFRSLDQIASDFRAIDPEFTRITNGNQLLGEFLVDHPMDEAFAATTGAGPVVFDLGVLDGPEWEGVRTLLDSQLVSQPARTELRQLGADLRATDTNGDRYLNIAPPPCSGRRPIRTSIASLPIWLNRT